MISFPVINQWVMGFVIAFSSLNILPLIIFPSLAALFLGLIAVLGLIKERKIPLIFAGQRKYFIAFIVLNIVYAGLIGVNILDPHLYRHEFKYMIPFSIFISLSLLVYKKQTETIVYYTLNGVVAFSFFWLIFSLIDRHFYNLHLYPYLGVIWERVGLEPVYLGPYQTHNSAGGFYAILSLIFLGLLKTVRDSRRSIIVFVELILILICFFFTHSRAYFLALAILTATMLGIHLFKIRKTRTGFREWVSRFSAGALDKQVPVQPSPI